MSSGINRDRLSRRAFAGMAAAVVVLPPFKAFAQAGQLPASPKRIVVLDAGLAGYAFALGAPVVAADTRFSDGQVIRRTGFPRLWSKQAVAAGTTALPQEEGGHDLEAIRAATPDLIIAGGRNPGGQASRAMEAVLSDIAPTLVVADDLSDWREELDLVAKATGRADAVAGLISAYEKRTAEVAGKIILPQGDFALLQANGAGLGEDPYAIADAGTLGATLSSLGFPVIDATAKVAGSSRDSLGRVSVPLAEVPNVFGTPNLLVVSSGTITLGQLCCNPPYRQLQAVDTRQRWELDESALRPDYLAALRMLDMIEGSFGKKS